MNWTHKLKKDDLSTIGLNLKFTIKQNGKERSLFKNISIFKPGLSGFVKNIENSFQQMKYILTNDERKKAKGKKGKGLSKLPKPVRNKMGFMKKGGRVTKSKMKKVK